jgi:nucleotide-binding universal stress UspA family protein
MSTTLTITRILCPVDFSEFSQHALARAIAIAKARGASVKTLHVVPLPSPVFPAYTEIMPTMPTMLEPSEREGLTHALDLFVAQQDAKNVAIETEVVEAPTVHGEILAQVGRLHADLVVMGTHGRSGFQRLFLGSVAEKVLRSATPPVLTVGAASDHAGAKATFTRILCAIDFSDCSLSAFNYALSLVEGTQAHITALNVLDLVPIASDPVMGYDPRQLQAAVERTAREHLERVVAERPMPGVEIEALVLPGRPHHEILRIAAERKADLIVLGIHGKNPLERMLFGSTAEPVVRRATCPVLTVRFDAAVNVAAA